MEVEAMGVGAMVEEGTVGVAKEEVMEVGAMEVRAMEVGAMEVVGWVGVVRVVEATVGDAVAKGGSKCHSSTCGTRWSRNHIPNPRLHSANQTHPETRLGRPAC